LSGRRNRSTAAIAVLLAILFVSGCSDRSPTNAPTPSAIDHPPRTPPMTGPKASSVEPPTSLNVEAVPQAFTTPLLDVATDGTSIVWSSGADAGPGVAPDVYQYIPGGSNPVKVFASSDRNATVSPIAVSGHNVMVVEANPEAKPGAWRLWYVAGPSTKPVLVDQSDALQGPYPFVAVDSGRVVWTAFHMRSTGPRSELTVATLPDLHREVLDSTPADRVEHWFPSLDGDNLVYGTVETSATSVARHVYLRDVAQPARDAVQLDSTGKAAMPAISGDNVVWKETVDNVLERGTLVYLSLHDHREIPIPFGDESQVNTPSIGNRFIAADAIDPTRFFLFDLSNSHSVLLREFPATGREVIVRPHLRGDLLVWAHSPAAEGADLILEWSHLPE
jgi:hypothetical protein